MMDTSMLDTFSLGEGTFMLFKQMVKQMDGDMRPCEHEHTCFRLIDGKIDTEWAQSMNTKMRLPEHGNDMHIAIVESTEEEDYSLTQRWRLATWAEYELAMYFLREIGDSDKVVQIVIGLLKNEIRELRLNEIGI